MTMILTEEQELIVSTAREFAVREIRPRIRQIEETDERPMDLMDKAAELGFRGITIPEEWGGLGLGLKTQVLVVEELAKEGYIGGSLANNMMATPMWKAGSEEQKERFLEGLATGSYKMGLAFTEAGAGSDASAIQTTAVRDGDEWVLNGTKIWISGAKSNDAFLVSARTNETAPGGISAFIVEKKFPGYSVGAMFEKIGLHGSETGEINLTNCRVPAKNMMGEENKGLRVVLSALDCGRVIVATIALGMAQGVFERAVAYAKQRVQFGKPIAEFQVIQHYAADMLKEIQVARAMIYSAAELADAKKPYSTEASIAKLYATEMCCHVADRAIQICGGFGLTKDGDIERYYRDARILPIVEGTSEIQKMVIARTIFPKPKVK